MSPVATFLGATLVEPAAARISAALGVAPPATFHGAISLVVNGAGRRLRVDLPAAEAYQLAEALAEPTARSPYLVRDGLVAVLLVDSLRLRIGHAVRMRLHDALLQRALGADGSVAQAPVAGEVVV